MAPTVSCLNKLVHFEPSFKAEEFSKVEYATAYVHLSRHGLIPFATFLQAVLLNKSVRQFYETLFRDPVSNRYSAEIKVYTSPDFTKSKYLEIDVTGVVRSLFKLSYRGMFLYAMEEKDASELTQPTALFGQHTYGTAHTVNLQPIYKVLTKFIHTWWFGYTGSNDQISLINKSLLAALMQEDEYNCKEKLKIFTIWPRNLPLILFLRIIQA